MIGRLVLSALVCAPALLAPALFPVAAGPAPAHVHQDQKPTKLWVYVGTYTRGTKAKGVYRAEFDAATGKLGAPALAVETDNPSFLAVHPTRDFLYAVNEVDDFTDKKEGAVSAFQIDRKDGGLELLNQVESAGPQPCHLSVDPTGKTLLVANYGNGTIAALPIDDGKKREDHRGRVLKKRTWINNVGYGPNKMRQEGPHAHCILTDPAGRTVLVADLGVDSIMTYTLDPDRAELKIPEPHSTLLNPGSGPRHLAFHPGGKFLYCLNELDSTVSAFAYNADKRQLKSLQTLSTLPKTFKGTNLTAEVAVHPSGKFLYASNRGHDSIAVFAIDDKTGRLKAVGLQTNKIRTPRHFALDPSGAWLLAANQDADTIVVFRVDPKTGLLAEAGVEVQVPRPVCIKMVPRTP